MCAAGTHADTENLSGNSSRNRQLLPQAASFPHRWESCFHSVNRLFIQKM
ncbi:hypothetical protein HMPREF9120_02429 [Neisseria sp. oral taxon 020 str. F0370]|nr:hypothetical protein HMPREF9120_02429 [Neisseria sp. oral taxon 020 str. F0370]